MNLPPLVPVRSSVVKAVGYVRLVGEHRIAVLIGDARGLVKEIAAPGFILIRLHSSPSTVYAYLREGEGLERGPYLYTRG